MIRTVARRIHWGIWIFLASVSFPLSVSAENFSVQTSSYWCDRLGGSFSGDTCDAPYVADSGACDKFEQLQPDDPQMKQTLEEVRASGVCIGDTVDQAKTNSLRLRADLMGYVTAGGNENVNDPTHPDSAGIIERAQNGGAPYWPLVSYYLYQCVVEVCEAK
jgi:hypothetical protein